MTEERDDEADADTRTDADPEEGAPAADEPFDEEEYEPVDADDVWEQVSESSEAPTVRKDLEAEAAAEAADEAADSGSEPESGEEAEVGAEAEAEAVNVVESRVCRTCPYFGEPPELHCTHEGTQIREVLDTGHYVVVDCPVVAEDVDFE